MDHSPSVARTRRDVGRWRRWRGWLSAVLLAACVDGPTSPGLFGELRIRPSYPDGDAPAVLGLSVDSAKVRVVRASEPTIALIDTMVRYESDTASMGWVLTLRENEETLLVDVAVWDGGSRVYSGEREVVVREAAIVESGAEPVLVAYIGPAIVKTVTLSPESVTLEALDAKASFAAEARDRHDQTVSTTFGWTSENADVAKVDATGVVTAVGNGTTTIHATSGSATGAATVVVEQRVASVSVTPESPTLTALGATSQLQATVRDANGFVVAGASVTWASSDDAVARVDEAGTVTAVSGGAATITATSNGVEGTTRVTVNPVANVASVVVSPADAVLSAVSATTQFTATARDASGNVLTGVQFVWTSTAEDVATVDATTGLATAVGHGAATIVGTAGSVSGGATLAVDLTTTIASIAVSPPNVTMTALGATQQFTAEARDANGVVIPGISCTWASSATNVASIGEATGLATVTGNGSTSITASANGVSGTANLTADLAPTVTSIVVSPATASLNALGATQQFTAVARDAQNNIVSGVVYTWSSSRQVAATIDPSSGLATAVGHGAANVVAAIGGVQGTAVLTVDLVPTVASIVVTPATVTLASLGASQQFTAEARDANGAAIPGMTFTWSSSAEDVATIGEMSGLATVTGNGSTTIAASANDVAGTATLTADLTAVVASVVVMPMNATLTTIGSTQQFSAVARDANNAIVPGVLFTWSSANESVATIDQSSGLATAAGHGLTTVVAAIGDVQGSATLTVDLVSTVASIVVTPASVTLTSLGATQQFTAQARDAGGAAIPGMTFTWSSSAEDVATIEESTGLATVTGNGSTMITATANGVSDTAALTADLGETIASIVVSPASASLTALGATQQFTAVARDANNAIVPGVSFMWSSSNESVAIIDQSSGLATAAGHGSTNIVAAVGDVQGDATLTVDLVPTVASIVVTPASVTLTSLGASQQFTAEARDENGAVVPGMTFAWTSGAEDVATIGESSGLATVTGNGSAMITATANAVSGTATLTADLTPTITSIVVSPANSTLTAVGATQQFTAEARDGNGAVLPNVPFTWSTSAPNVATVDATTGLAAAVAHGVATITATANGQQGTATLTVDLMPIVVRIVVSPASATLTALEATQQFMAEAFDANDAIVPGITFGWNSSAADVATVGASSGLAAAIGQGTTTIAATAGDVAGTATLNVDLTTAIASIEVSPASSTLTALGATQQFTAVARDASGNLLPGVTFSWSSSADAVATVNATTGLATALENGTATVTATANGMTGTASLTVEQRVARVDVTPASLTIAVGEFKQLAATAYDANDNAMSGVTFVWSSSDSTIARVSSTGLVTGKGAGTATIRAASGDVSGTAMVVVQ